MIDKIFPGIAVIRTYTLQWLKSDLIAGITVSIILIPQAIAYALLMGVPAVYGLYSCLVPLIIYAFLGTSTQLSIGPVAITSILVMSGVSQISTPFTSEFTTLVLCCGFMIGILQLCMGFLRMGFLVNLISQPVISGFISAAAIIIIVSQCKGIFGIQIPDSGNIFQTLGYLYQHINESNLITIIIGFSSMLVMILIKKWKKSFPGALVVLIISTFFTYFFQLQNNQVEIIASVPKGLPSFLIPIINLEMIHDLLPTILSTTFIGYVGSIGIAKSIEIKKRDHIIRPNQELFALGMAKVFGAFFQAIPSSGSYSRTAINDEAGGKTTISSLITAVIVVISVSFLTPLFYYIPKSVLSAIIIVSVYGLINFSEAKHLLNLRRREFIVMMITFIGTLIFGVENGIFIGILLSFIFLQYYSSRPHIAELVNIPNTSYYRNINRFPNAIKSDHYMIIRFDDQLYFANSGYFKDAVIRFISKRPNTPNYFILDATNIHDIDSTGIHILDDIYTYLKNSGIQLMISGTIGPVRDILKRSGFRDSLGAEYFFIRISDAVDFTKNKTNPLASQELASQFNAKRSFLD